MRVLLVNPETPLGFWTFRESCELAEKRALMPPMGLITVAALLPQEWELRLADLTARPLDPCLLDWADVVMVSGMIVQSEHMLPFIAEAKRKGKIVVAGGPFATSVPRKVIEAGTDFLVSGEGEDTIPRFLDALAGGAPSGVFEEQAKPAMSASPVPRFDLLNLNDYVILGIQTSRGCPFNCEFCDIVNLFGRVPRHKTPDQVIAELEALYRLGWRSEIMMTDDNFVGNRTHARAILHRLIPWMKSHGEPFGFWTQASVNLGQDQELMDLMTEANFSHVFVGVETPDADVLTANRKHQNVRHPLAQSLINLKRNGLSVMASFIIGFDNEKPGADARIIEFVENVGLPMVMLNTLYALPNTALWDRLKREGRLFEDDLGGSVLGGTMNFVPSRPKSEILEEFVRAVDVLYEPSRYLERAYRYVRDMRPTRGAMSTKSIESSREPAPQLSVGLKDHLRNLRGLVKLLWRQGVGSSYRRQFWKQLLGVYRNNPSRLIRYLHSLVIGENMLALRPVILESIHAACKPADAASDTGTNTETGSL
jgi:radical SAM superfamily enzyme YgiQ (UPF0313 family)